ncbi:RNA polymerase II subunit A C-terminal domain phosphatase SSU72 isoform X2 [Pseudoliparis swirei]|uniref:RNA polymerase II subunit A C-terminal domain phosphatase SSU72 isoform X2 n=1 Tax=Pseudoliparis swirei TaxID=2059687 RepID=UPI0024BE7D34|nr:RNA polymerase II subunit A C-terminal domain phosphatase SSU72 isoform X2 [Pseudoliparis swirei]
MPPVGNIPEESNCSLCNIGWFPSADPVPFLTHHRERLRRLWVSGRRKRGFDVRSFGTGSHVKLPGPAPDKPNVYDFKTTYVQMYNDLVRKDKELYTQNGILHMLDRNKRIKSKPERFQSCKDMFDLVITCEERVYDQVLEDLNSREQETLQSVHVINVDIQDNHEEATLGAFLICELCQCIQHTDDMEDEMDELIQEFEEKSNRPFLHTVCFY